MNMYWRIISVLINVIILTETKHNQSSQNEGDETMKQLETRWRPPDEPRFFEPRPRKVFHKFQPPPPDAQDYWTHHNTRRYYPEDASYSSPQQPQYYDNQAGSPGIHYHYHPEHNYIHYKPSYYPTPESIYIKPVKPVRANVVKLESLSNPDPYYTSDRHLPHRPEGNPDSYYTPDRHLPYRPESQFIPNDILPYNDKKGTIPYPNDLTTESVHEYPPINQYDLTTQLYKPYSQNDITTQAFRPFLQQDITTQAYRPHTQTEISTEVYRPYVQQDITTQAYRPHPQNEISTEAYRPYLQQDITTQAYSPYVQQDITTQAYRPYLQNELSTETFRPAITTSQYKQYDPKFIELLTQIYKNTDGFTRNNPFQMINGNYGIKTQLYPVPPDTTSIPPPPTSTSINDIIIPTTYKPQLNYRKKIKRPPIEDTLAKNKYLQKNKSKKLERPKEDADDSKYPDSIQDQLPPPKHGEDTRIPYINTAKERTTENTIVFRNTTDKDEDKNTGIDVRFGNIQRNETTNQNAGILRPDINIPRLPLEDENTRQTVIDLASIQEHATRIKFPDEFPDSTEIYPTVVNLPPKFGNNLNEIRRETLAPTPVRQADIDESIRRITNLTVVGLSQFKDNFNQTKSRNPFMRSFVNFEATNRMDYLTDMLMERNTEHSVLQITPRASSQPTPAGDSKILNLKIINDEEFKHRNPFVLEDDLSLDAKILRDTNWDGFIPDSFSRRTPSPTSNHRLPLTTIIPLQKTRKVEIVTVDPRFHITMPVTTMAPTTTVAPITTTEDNKLVTQNIIIESRVTKTVSKYPKRNYRVKTTKISTFMVPTTSTPKPHRKKYRRRQKYSNFTSYPKLDDVLTPSTEGVVRKFKPRVLNKTKTESESEKMPAREPTEAEKAARRAERRKAFGERRKPVILQKSEGSMIITNSDKQ